MDNDTLKKYKQAGQINAKALQFGRKLIIDGNRNTLDIVTQVEEFIEKNKTAKIAFPVNLSLNTAAAHDTADYDDKRIIPDDAVIKLDCGTHIDGYIADAATTIDLSGDYAELCKASIDALNEAVKIATPGTTIGEIGRMIQEVINSYDYNPISNLSGHYLNRYELHTGVSIPNVKTNNQHKLKENDVLAIEPFATTGHGKVKEQGSASIFLLKKKTPLRIASAKELMNEIDARFNGLPFAYRHLFNLGIDKSKIPLAFSLIKKSNCLVDFPMLVEESKGIVSQAEHTVIVRDKPIVTTKLDED